jgi:hypothetical protein
MISGYFKLVTLSEEIKTQNKIKVGAIVPRLDCVEMAGNYKGLAPFMNSKGMLYFNLTPSREIIETHGKRYAEFCLTVNSMNFGSLYKFLDLPNYAYSYPNSKPTLGKERKPNPLFNFRSDLYLMIVEPDYSQIEILIVEDCKNLAEEYLQSLIDGYFDEEIERLRKEVKPMFEYIGYAKNCH